MGGSRGRGQEVRTSTPGKSQVAIDFLKPRLYAHFTPGCKFTPGLILHQGCICGHVNEVLRKYTWMQICIRVQTRSNSIGGANLVEQISTRVQISF